MKKLFPFLAVLLLATACGSLGVKTLLTPATPTLPPPPTVSATVTPAATPTPSDSPELAAREWLQAIADVDGIKLDDRTCTAQVKGLQSGTLLPILFGSVGEQAKNKNAKTDVSALKVATINATGDSAQVRVTGRIRGGEGASVLSEVIDETWQITREDGKWKFCGHPLLTEQDLPRLVLQPSEVPVFLFDAEDGVEEISRHHRDIGTWLRNAGAIGGAYRDYRAPQEPSRIYSTVYLFDSPEAGRRGFASLMNAYQRPAEEGGGIKLIRTSLSPLGLGDEDRGILLELHDSGSNIFRTYIYAWRSANAVFFTSIYFNSMEESKIRPFAFKTQAHAYSNAEPEILPTPVFQIPSPTDMYPPTETATPTQ